jgi:hypothetical protein
MWMTATVIIHNKPIPTIKTSRTKRTMTRIKSILNSTVEMDIMTSRKPWHSPFLIYDSDIHSGYYNADPNSQYQQDGGYYEGHHQDAYQDEYNDQYYDQVTPAAGQQPYGQNNGYDMNPFATSAKC